MNVGKVFLVASAVAVVAATALIVAAPGSQEPPKTFLPQGGERPPVDATDIFKNPDPLPRFNPRHPELGFVEHSDGLPQSGTWRGYPLLHDFNGDGRADLVASNREEDGYGVWVAPSKGPWVRSVDGPKKGVGGLPADMAYGPARAADMDSDGRADLLLSAHTDALRLYRNVLAEDDQGRPTDDGKLHWSRTESAIENPFLMLDIDVGDIDGDGLPDIAGIGHFKGGIGIYLGDGKGGMRRLPESGKLLDSKSFGQRLQLADLDGDGANDIVTASNRGLKVFLTRRGPPLAWEERSAGLPQPKIGNSITGLCVGSFRGGKTPEIVACLVPDPTQDPKTHDTIGVYAWNAEKKQWEHVDAGLPRNEIYRDVVCGDMNKDGHLDLIAMSRECGGVIYLGDGRGGFAAKGRLPGIRGVGRLALGDVDADGLLDVIVSIPATKERPEDGGLRAMRNRPELWN